MTLCHTLNVRMVDPRPANILDCFHKTAFQSLPKIWQQKISSQDPSILEGAVKRRYCQLVKYFPSDANVGEVITELERDEEMLEAVRHTTLLIGMHSDSSATEAIVHIALHYCKPFMVVPCCVFLNFFKQQFLPSEEEGKMVPVRSHNHTDGDTFFCKP